MGISLRGSINRKCKECIYDNSLPGNGTWRAQVEACTASETCALWPVRPKSTAKKEKRDDDSV